MPRPYSVDLRERVMAAVADGTPMIEVGQQFSGRVDAIADWKRLQARTGRLAPVGHHIGRTRSLSPAPYRLPRERSAAVPDANSGIGWRRSTSAVWRAFARAAHAEKMGLIATQQDADQRATWQADQAVFLPKDLVLIDETKTQTKLTRTHGRAPKGERLVAVVPRNHGPNVTCLAALTATGIGPSIVFEGALDGTIFTQWIMETLVPTLRPGQIEILDTLSVHTVATARKVTELAGCRLRFLPACSPDFNPIEQDVSRVKAHCAPSEPERSPP